MAPSGLVNFVVRHEFPGDACNTVAEGLKMLELVDQTDDWDSSVPCKLSTNTVYSILQDLVRMAIMLYFPTFRGLLCTIARGQ